MLTLHTSGGFSMMEAAEKAAQDTAKSLNIPPPLARGVTVLTSMDGKELSELGLQPDVGRQVERLAQLAVRAGLRGLVCSPLEIAMLRSVLPAHVQLVTPGIRAGTDKMNDQKRTLSAAEAIQAGATWLVIGRPICAAKEPEKAAQQILDSLA
jgi:orotidine-5'-phosphate decarboxylase